MSESPSSLERFEELLSQFVDGALSADEFSELQACLSEDAARRDRLVNLLLLDSLLAEEIGAESVTALVDLVSDSDAMPVVPVTTSGAKVASKSPTGAQSRKTQPRWKLLGWLSVAALIAVLAFSVGRWENSAFANAATIIRAAVETHAAPIERVYLVEVERSPELPAEFTSVREVRVATQGDRFYVEMNRGQRQWYWGRDAAGAIWLTVGPRRAVVVEPDELGVPLQYISDLYTLNLETLLDNFLKHCRLDRSDESESTHVITATPRYRWRGGWIRRATIEVDRETKVVRRLIIERELPQQGPSTVTFTLVDSRPADEAKYRPEGHLAEPFRLLTRETQPDQRRELMTNWFGPAAARWIVSLPKADAVQNLSPESEQALRQRVAELFESLRSGDVETCLKLTDPDVVRKKGRSQVLAFFRSVSGLVRTSGIQSQDRVVTGVSLIENGQAARVNIEVTLNDVVQPAGFEIWGLMGAQWYYRETPK